MPPIFLFGKLRCGGGIDTDLDGCSIVLFKQRWGDINCYLNHPEVCEGERISKVWMVVVGGDTLDSLDMVI